jgi:hypothetical protein
VPPAPEQGLQRQHAAAVAHPTVGSSLLRVTRLPAAALPLRPGGPITRRLQQFGDRSTGYAGPGTLPASGLGGAATQPWRPVRSARSPLQAIL